MKRYIYFILPFLIGIINAGDGSAGHGVDGKILQLYSIIPFIGILLSIAITPLVAPSFWHHNFGKISFFWAALFLIPFSISYGLNTAVYELLHVLLLEYLPFIILLLSLYTVGGGIQVEGTIVGKPKTNLIMLITGTVLASWMGTTGAAMLLIRPLIRANNWRRKNVHIIIFFIFLVANIGGSLTPLGDPPLFLGFLQGVSFFWTTKALIFPMLIVVVLLLILFFIIDNYYFRKEFKEMPLKSNQPLSFNGKFNFILIVCIVFSVLLSGFWKPGIDINLGRIHLKLQNIMRDILLLVITVVSWKMTDIKFRKANGFTWFPIKEVAKLFAGIFITIIPAIAILKAGNDGAMSALFNVVMNPETGNPVNKMYFWLTGFLSSFLDNAPTYLVFFNTAGGDASLLMTEYYSTLLAISCGAVFMGAMTYIGNAPNFMVKSIAEENQIKMPSFFGFLVYSSIILLPVFIIITYIYF